ncbi:MAG: 16S rRNA pseudouridine(516) synthase [Clostridia bacterium]|nr:16S rRNA pseudouridine(516) synthase [Clostridia bacterium]
MTRLDALISQAGEFSRSDIKIMVKKGRVSVNGQTVKDYSLKVSESDNIAIDGKTIDTAKFIYIMLNKPAGYVSATEGDKNVIQLVPQEMFRKGLFPVGRLDKDTEGLLLITNDGDFAHKLMSPNKNVVKTYRAKIERPITDADIEAFAKGIVMRDGTEFKPAILRPFGENSAEVEISEGKYHQVKLMFAARENKVLYLERLAIGGLTLEPNLKRGECLRMTAEMLDRI